MDIFTFKINLLNNLIVIKIIYNIQTDSLFINRIIELLLFHNENNGNITRKFYKTSYTFKFYLIKSYTY